LIILNSKNNKIEKTPNPKPKEGVGLRKGIEWKNDSDKLIHWHEWWKCQRRAARKRSTDQKLMKESDSDEEQDWENYFRQLLYHDEIVHQG